MRVRIQRHDALQSLQNILHRRCGSDVRGYPETFSYRRSEIKQPPCGNETQGDRRERAYSA
jgi:hypothetical protein